MATVFRTNDDIRHHIEKSGHEFWSIGQAINGLPIYCVKLGGKRLPAVLMTAGSHAAEPGGVIGALKLIAELHTDYAVYVVPNRDPMGFEGYHRYLAFALGTSVSFEDNRELAALLRRIGQVVHDDQDLVLALVGQLAFAAMEPSPRYLGPSEVYLKVKRLLGEDSELRERLGGKRVVVPTNMPNSEGCGLFERAYTCFVTEDGRLKNFNRLFGTPSAPQEVKCVQDLADQIKPGLSLDLHEGFGSGFYLIVPPFAGNRSAETIARSIVSEVRERGARLYSLGDLRDKFPDGGIYMRDLGDGILEEEVSKSDMQETLMAYASSRYGPGFGVEAGRESGLEQRGLLHLWAACAAVRAFEDGRVRT